MEYSEAMLDLIDEKLALKFMRFKKKVVKGVPVYYTKEGVICECAEWKPTRDANASNIIIEDIPALVQIHKHEVPMFENNQYVCTFSSTMPGGGRGEIKATAPTLPIAICLAALKIVGIDPYSLKVKKVKKVK